MIFPLPSCRHVPGSGSEPDRAPLEQVKATTPPTVTDTTWNEVPAYLYGIQLYANGYFWEAHEVWEPVWLATTPNSRERHLMAALIQLTNACLKLVMQLPNAASRLLQETADRLIDCGCGAGGFLMGIDIGSLARRVAELATAVRNQEGGQIDRLLEMRPTLIVSLDRSTTAG